MWIMVKDVSGEDIMLNMDNVSAIHISSSTVFINSITGDKNGILHLAYGEVEKIREKISVSSYTGWIPLNAIGGEPEEEGNYLVQFSDNIITTVYYNGKDFELWYDSPEPVAWMPLPKPYKTESEK